MPPVDEMLHGRGPIPSEPTAMPSGAAAAVEEVLPDEEISRWLEWSEEAVKSQKQKNPRAIHRKLIRELEAAGVPKVARRRITMATIGSNKVPTSLLRAAGDKADAMKDLLATARAAYRSPNKAELNAAFREVLDGLVDAGVDEDIVKEIRRVGPKTILKHGPKQVTAAYARRGRDPILMQLFNRVTKRKGVPQLAPAVAEQVKGVVPTRGVTKALTKAGVRGMSGPARFARGVTGVPALVGAGLQAYWTVPMLMRVFGGGKRERAEAMMASGVTAGGQKVTSAELLRQIIEMQDAVSARRSVAMKQEPGLTRQVLQAIAGPSQERMITPSQIAFGSAAPMTRQSTPDRGVVLKQFDQMLSQLGNY